MFNNNLKYKASLQNFLRSILLFMFSSVFFLNCGDFSLFSQISQTVQITVTDADQTNSNKTTPAVAVELWAASTRYETSGYEFEKVKLENKGGGTWKGILPLADSGVSIIIFDDAQALKIPFGNITKIMGNSFFTFSQFVTADDYFSPCTATIEFASGSPFYDLITNNSLTVFTGTQTGSNGTTTNDEVYTTQYISGDSSSVEVNYTNFQKASFAWFCNCSKSVQWYTASTVYNSGANQSLAAVNFTDDNLWTDPYISNPTVNQNGGTTCPSR